MGKIGIFGGSFDPVHKGHYRLAMAAIEELDLEKLIIVPANVQPFKQDRNPSKAGDRLNMLKLAFHEEPKVEISSYEIDRAGISYTFNTLRHFRDAMPDSKIVFIMGGDSIITLDKWFNGREMLRDYSFAVSYRPGYEEALVNEAIYKYKKYYGADITKLKTEMPDISSTEIRSAIAGDAEISDILSAEVIKYIRENKLYE